VRFHPPDGLAAPAIPGATLPALSGLDPRATSCASNRARFADALGRWAAEESSLPGVPLAAADRTRFIRAIEKVRTAAPFSQRGATWVGPNVADLYQLAGFCAVDESRWADAERELTKAAALDPLQSSPRSELAFVYTRLHRLDEADRLASEALELATNDCERARSLRLRGYLAIERGQLLEALQAYHHSLELAPGNPTAEHEISVILTELRRVGGASAKAAAAYRPPPASPDVKVTACPR
jgi:Flp pilus assembly protein TadD